jgi:hypothetical protein
MSAGARKLRRASALILVALLVELVRLVWSPPAVLTLVGGAALGAGLLLYLHWLLCSRAPDEVARGNT